MNLKSFLLLLTLLPFYIYCQSSVKIDSTKSLNIGESVYFYSEVLKENREVNIYLPSNYHPDSNKTYSVIYLLDGSIQEDLIHVSGIFQFASFPWINMAPECIIVGISNVDRKRDFTFPTTIEADQRDFPSSGGSSAFIKFIETELQPLVNDKFKTNGNNTLIGQSLGGLLATEILFKNGNLFNNYIIVSPSLWWDNESLLELIPVEYLRINHVHIAVGNEGKIMIKDAKQLYKKLSKKLSKENLSFAYYKELDHGDALHLSVYHALKKLFATKSE
ncbi:alpha/beta hydrolase [Paracrocinitomix mangrovi]|uniref:alpha/beta hydrolase n=1 Tax=Paracrocinitomix mangrovi TaxID=2862509 RepID=UPI001C8D010C|nr:alpha/beta hydrolase-fold protein [Paracrocinitomix mangrovi]UKN02187.1 alpha/beta hydrolase [Paracrocinitomix mangrovi]